MEFDTNIFQVGLECLQNKTQIVTGDAVFCEKSGAVFNVHSVLTESEGKQIWESEFCNHKNEVMIDEEEIPKEDAVTYIIEAAAQVEDAAEE